MSNNTILATTPLVSTNYLLRATGTTIGNSLIFDNGTNVGIGNTNTTYKLDVSGTGNFTGALTGTSATFSGQVDIVKSIPTLLLKEIASRTTGTRGEISWDNSASSTVAAIRATALTDNVGTGLEFYTRPVAGSLTKTFDIASTGAATFSSSVNMGGDLALTPNDSAITFSSGAGRFFTGGTERMRITSGGNVWVGNDSNPYIEIANGGSTDVKSGIKWMVGGGRTYYGAIELATPSASNSYLSFSTMNSGTVAEKMRITSGGDINMNATSGNKLVTVKGQTGNGYYGEVRLGNVDHSAGIIGRHVSSGNANLEFWTENYSSGGYTLKMTITASGNIGAPTGTNIYNASDVRFKQNITTITNGLDKIIGLNPIKFNWIEGFEESEDGKDMLGFIAQEVQNVIPEAVENFGNNSITIGETIIDNPLRVNEKFIIPVLVKAIQEMNTKSEEQQAIITSLQARLETLENK